MTPTELDLPYSAWSDGQWNTIARLASSDKPYLLLEAPTGTGKSAVALALARLLEVTPTLVVTGTKQLQAQYAGDFDLPMVMGRSNFPCILPNILPGTTADLAPCTVGHKCVFKSTPDCPYYAQKLAAQAAPEAVLNFAFWLAQANYAHAFNRPQLLVIDEAHTLEDEVRRFVAFMFRRRQFDLLKLRWPNLDTPDQWRYWSLHNIPQLRRLQARIKMACPINEHATSDDVRLVNAITTTLDTATRLTAPDFNQDGWTASDQPAGVEFRPVWVTPYVKPLVLDHAPKILFMSATILDPGLWAYQLGIPESKLDFVQVPSTFPQASRPLYYQSVGKVKARDPDVLDALSDQIDLILDKHPDQNGLIHTGSYKIAKHIMERSRHANRLLTHTSRNRADIISSFSLHPGAVLVSPSVTTGVDLPYDACRFQIIAKLQFPDLGDPQTKLRMRVGPDGLPNPRGQSWYSWATACALVQAYGRGMRRADDACTTYLLDGNWKWFRSAVRHILPGWFTEAIINLPSVADTELLNHVRQLRDAAISKLPA